MDSIYGDSIYENRGTGKVNFREIWETNLCFVVTNEILLEIQEFIELDFLLCCYETYRLFLKS